eukprot:TRINITY_DN37428_c0_g1_i1.p1 TRINITY_DN37428_c0_g1~~TRINITY_DN37428_c0_g1_i1.p1  ORF type:complete len:337 (+),score=123.13 TRINITY_DN37428_c0_g1_i1:239-1249(+)
MEEVSAGGVAPGEPHGEAAVAQQHVDVEEEDDKAQVEMWVGVPDGGLTAAEKKRATACKIGGFPTFSNTAKGEAAKAELEEKSTCRVCGDKMYLLAQAFCPYGEMERIIYVLVCNCSHCHAKKDKRAPWRVFCFQESEIIDDESPVPEGADGEEDGEAGGLPVPKALPWSYPEMAFDTFEEPESAGTEEEEMQKALNINKEVSDSISGADLASMEQSGCVNMTDECVAKFQARLARCPQQVVRWGVGGKPLWMTTAHRPSVSSIPDCERCGNRRTFELQLVPTLVWVLQMGKHLKPTCGMSDEGMDFGTAAVYTCTHCTQEGLSEEYVHVQPQPEE